MSSYIQIGGIGSTAFAENSIISEPFAIPESTNIVIDTKALIHGEKFVLNYATDFIVNVNGSNIISQNSGTIEKDYSLSGNGSLSTQNNTIKCFITSKSVRCHAKIKTFNVRYR